MNGISAFACRSSGRGFTEAEASWLNSYPRVPEFDRPARTQTSAANSSSVAILKLQGVVRPPQGAVQHGPSTPQEADSIGPVPFRGFPGEVAQGSYEATKIRWRDGLFVDKNHPTMLSPFFCPRFEQWGNRPSVVGHERQPLHSGLLQTGEILLS